MESQLRGLTPNVDSLAGWEGANGGLANERFPGRERASPPEPPAGPLRESELTLGTDPKVSFTETREGASGVERPGTLPDRLF